jgi:hypothetical protein
MEFRWIAALTLWTMLVGPVLDMRVGTNPAQSQSTRLKSTKLNFDEPHTN